VHALLVRGVVSEVAGRVYGPTLSRTHARPLAMHSLILHYVWTILPLIPFMTHYHINRSYKYADYDDDAGDDDTTFVYDDGMIIPMHSASVATCAVIFFSFVNFLRAFNVVKEGQAAGVALVELLCFWVVWLAVAIAFAHIHFGPPSGEEPTASSMVGLADAIKHKPGIINPIWSILTLKVSLFTAIVRTRRHIDGDYGGEYSAVSRK
jgi:hypothetical protein